MIEGVTIRTTEGKGQGQSEGQGTGEGTGERWEPGAIPFKGE